MKYLYVLVLFSSLNVYGQKAATIQITENTNYDGIGNTKFGTGLINLESVSSHLDEISVGFQVNKLSANFHLERFHYEDADNFQWYGRTSSIDGFLNFTIKDGRVTGLMKAGKDLEMLRFYAIDSNGMVEFKKPSGIFDCTQEFSNGVCNETSNFDCGPVAVQNCLDECRAHIDFLFLVTPEALDYFAGNETEMLLNVEGHLQDLRTVWHNSNIRNTIDYDWVYFDGEVDYSQRCFSSICELSSSSQDANYYRDLYDSDVVVLLGPPQEGTWPGGHKACVANYGPDEQQAYVGYAVDYEPGGFVFAHEIGHIFGLEHVQPPQPTFQSCCHYGYTAVYPDGSQKRTVMVNPLANDDITIPFYSDPNIIVNGMPIGVYDPIAGEHINNAGQLRSSSCTVAEFRDKDDPVFFVDFSIVECNYKFELVNSANEPVGTQIDWYLSDNGLFSIGDINSYNFLGTGVQVDISSTLLPDPCLKYFVHAVFTHDGQYMTHRDLVVPGGACINNVWCGEGTTDDKSILGNMIDHVWLYDYRSGFEVGIIEVNPTVDSVIGAFTYKKMERTFTLLIGGDTLRGTDVPVFYAQEGDILYASFNGLTGDTLFNFSASIGDEWEYNYLHSEGEARRLSLTLIDTFSYVRRGEAFKGQSLLFDYGIDGLPIFEDTIIEGIGFLNSYIDPWEFFYNSAEERLGYGLRCFRSDGYFLDFERNNPPWINIDCEPITSNTPVLENADTYSIQVLGNPINSELRVLSEYSQPIRFEIYDVSGKVVKRTVLSNGITILDTNNWADGLYIGITGHGQVVRFIRH